MTMKTVSTMALAPRGPKHSDNDATSVLYTMDETRALWTRARASVVGILVMASVLLFTQHAFGPLVEPLLMTAWLAWMWSCVLLFVGASVALLTPRIRARLSRRTFITLGRVVAVGFCAGIVTSVWILMPPANGDLRLLMILLCMWFVAMVVILNPDAASIWGALAVVVSMAAFILVYEMPYAWALAGFLIGEGVALVAIRRLIWRAADRFEAAMVIAAAERDAKTRFIAAASHDLQQPIQAAWMFAENGMASGNDLARARAAAGMRASFASVQSLLETMLDHLRLEAGAVVARRDPVALGPLIAEVVAEHQGAAGGAQLRLVAIPTRRTATGDAALIKRALGNLVGNAVRHSDGRRVLIGARGGRDRVSLWVIDDGRGIAPADRARLFDDFAQGSEGGQSRGGFGIGLASVRRIAALMDGDARLDPRWTGGAAFALTLPAAQESLVRCEAA